jgi:hypothetical protein
MVSRRLPPSIHRPARGPAGHQGRRTAGWHAGALWAAAFAAWMLNLPGALGAEHFEVLASRRGDVVEVRARADIQAPLDVVWGTLTDYERLPDFIPGLKTSRIVARDGSRTTVAQTGEARFLFFSRPIDIVVESNEVPPHLEVRLVSGTLRSLQGRYETAALADPPGVELRWNGSVGADIQMPDWIGQALVRRLIERQFAGMVKEIERREAARRAALSSPHNP